MGYTARQLQDLLKTECYRMYERINNYISDNYNVDQIWEDGGKYGDICLRYRRSGKTFCTIYFRKNQLGIWIILGKEERRKFEEMQKDFSVQVQDKYECTETYHDGKWLMFDVDNTDLFHDIKMILEIKKSPNRKLTMCGYCCDMCKAFVGNIKRKDERNILSDYWKKYYDLTIPVEQIQCDGCRCKKTDAHRIDETCPVRTCVQNKKINDCSECESYPCETFMSRKGLSYDEANEIDELDILSYYEYLGAFDNKSRLNRRLK